MMAYICNWYVPSLFIKTIEKQLKKNRLDNLKNAKGFDKNPQNINRHGRPRRLVSLIIYELKEQGIESVKPNQIIDVFEMLFNLESKEIAEIANNDKNPYFIRRVAKEMLSGKGFDIIERMIDRVHGKPKQATEITGKDGDGLTINFVPAKK